MLNHKSQGSDCGATATESTCRAEEHVAHLQGEHMFVCCCTLPVKSVQNLPPVSHLKGKSSTHLRQGVFYHRQHHARGSKEQKKLNYSHSFA